VRISQSKQKNKKKNNWNKQTAGTWR